MRVYEGDTGDGLVEVLVVKVVKPDPGAGRLPESVRSFAARTPKFPRASITRQDFGDVEFEAYRALGERHMGLAGSNGNSTAARRRLPPVPTNLSTPEHRRQAHQSPLRSSARFGAYSRAADGPHL